MVSPPLTTPDGLKRAFDLGGRTALVVGAGNGLGRSSALLLGAAGASVISADIDGGRAEATSADIVAQGGAPAGAIEVDVTDKAGLEEAIAAVHAKVGRIDVLVNSAGTTTVGAVLDYPEAAYDRLFAINVKGTFVVCQAVGRIMCDQGGGSIINVSSAAIDNPTATRAVYAMTKAAVAQLTRNLAVEWGSMGVRVNALAPGFFPSGLTQHNWLGEDGEPDEAKMQDVRVAFSGEQVISDLGEASDQAYLTLYLASDVSRFVTGQIFRANGGLAMPW